MKKPEWNPVEIDLWREEIERKRLRKDVMGPLDFGRDIQALEDNENV